MVSVKTSHRTANGGLQGLMDRVQSLSNNKLYVGIPQEKTSRGDEPINNASLLYIHTHGIRRKSMREEMQGYMDQGMEYSLAYQLYVQTHGSPLWHAPPRPVIEPAIAKHHREIAEENDEAINVAIKLCLYCMKTQIFLDGNKRASVIFANHYLIAHGGGFLVIPEKEVPQFKQLLVKYYEGEDISIIATFMKERCWKTM